MERFAKNKVVLTVIVVIVGVGLIAAYIPLLFIPSSYEGTPQSESEAAQPTTEKDSIITTSTASSSKKAQASDLFSGIQDERQSLDELDRALNK